MNIRIDKLESNYNCCIADNELQVNEHIEQNNKLFLENINIKQDYEQKIINLINN